jgi:NADPH:quinone reductase-like Zn-dependent oxidoreductase
MMKAIFLVRTGNPSQAFEVREIDKPATRPGQVLIKVEYFGLNYADVMARLGMYGGDAPKIPCVLGYDVAGTIEKVAEDVSQFKPGDRVTAMTRFGGYAEYAITDARAVAKIPVNLSTEAATALTTQYCTAYYCAAECMNLYPGEKVLIHSAAGGVGTALVQFAKFKGCEIFGTTGSPHKTEILKKAGVQHVINTSMERFDDEVMRITGGKGVDAIFDAVGADYIKRGMKILAPGGKIVCYGASQMTEARNIFSKISKRMQFGFYHPGHFIIPSKSMIGVNMLHIADAKPEVLQRCLQQVVRLAGEKVFEPMITKTFDASEIAAAHELLGSRQSAGKIAVKW